MKSDYEQTLDENFDKALDLCSNTHSNKDLIAFLKNGNIPERQFASLEISKLESETDAEVFISNLINCDGKIREAVAQKFSEFVLVDEYRTYFSKYPEILAKSTIDINANISRMVIDGLVYMKEFSEFGGKYTQQLLVYINEAFDGLDKIIYKDKKYTINKQLFKLYWCLEGLNNYWMYLKDDVLYSLLERSLTETEYTVREKAAQIIVKQTSERYNPLKEKLSNDENYYVRRILNNK